jgi:hypothetical protein
MARCGQVSDYFCDGLSARYRKVAPLGLVLSELCKWGALKRWNSGPCGQGNEPPSFFATVQPRVRKALVCCDAAPRAPLPSLSFRFLVSNHSRADAPAVPH